MVRLYVCPVGIDDDPIGMIDDLICIDDDLFSVNNDLLFGLICPRRVYVHPFWLWINLFR